MNVKREDGGDGGGPKDRGYGNRDIPVQIRAVDRVGRVRVRVVDPALDRVDGQEPTEPGQVDPCAHLDGSELPGVLVELLVLPDPGVVRLIGQVVDHRVIRAGGAD